MMDPIIVIQTMPIADLLKNNCQKYDFMYDINID